MELRTIKNVKMMMMVMMGKECRHGSLGSGLVDIEIP